MLLPVLFAILIVVIVAAPLVGAVVERQRLGLPFLSASPAIRRTQRPMLLAATLFTPLTLLLTSIGSRGLLDWCVAAAWFAVVGLAFGISVYLHRLRADVRRAEGRLCPQCLYDLATDAATTCPECGNAYHAGEPADFWRRERLLDQPPADPAADAPES